MSLDLVNRGYVSFFIKRNKCEITNYIVRLKVWFALKNSIHAYFYNGKKIVMCGGKV